MLRLSLLATLVLGLLVSTFLTACTSPRLVEVLDVSVQPERETTPEELDAARARWQAAGLADYRFVYEVSCFCPEDARGPFTITVRDGVVQEVLFQGRPLDPEDPRHPTLDALFTTLGDAFSADAALVRAAYHPTLGYPLSAYVDYETMMADEELGFAVSAFTPLGGSREPAGSAGR
ncbi:MAG: DUF6174 domain-containing protein [Rubricoccaceae bacterium]|nr:DUF6174 domain-containing protein [Rubricoccaceae bacterium]